MLFYIVVFTFKKETEPIFFSFVKRAHAHTHTHMCIYNAFFFSTIPNYIPSPFTFQPFSIIKI